MCLSISKRELFIVLLIFIIMMLTFPLPSQAIETEKWHGKIQVVKTVNDIQNDQTNLSGFEFSLYTVSDGEEILKEIKTTNTDGILEFDELSEGTYKLYEKKLDNYIREISDQGMELSLTREDNLDGILIVETSNTKLYQKENLVEEIEEVEEIMEEEIEIEDEEDWEIVIIDEPIPFALPTFSKTESIDSVEEIVEIIVLPKTGELNSIPQSALGAIMVCLGVYINRKKMNEF